MNLAPDLLDWARGLLSVAFVVLLPMLIIGTSVRGVFTDRELILNGFRDNQVGVTTGLDDAQLQRVADAFVSYFQAPRGQMQMQIVAFGQPRLLFNDRETAHMEDVQALVQFFLRMQLVAAAVVAVRLVVGLAFERAVAPIGREMLWSMGLMIAAVVVVGSYALIDFDAFWTRFHQVAFRNDLWLLDPRRDYLIMLFPEPFWFTATIRFVTVVCLQTGLVIALGLGLVLSPRLLGGTRVDG
ncbi:MAG TPA: TIGR01906 family membrane protein [Chloroflexota bacterium]